MRRSCFFSCVVLALACPLAASQQARDPDRDGDGLSDFQELHKYHTDPASKDSDKDGVPDGNWNERREFSYTIRTIVRVLRPVDVAAMNDDHQDARVLDETDQYVEVEVIHYPLNTVHEAIAGNPRWKENSAAMKEFLAPGPTANWDEAMRARLIADLKAAGIDVAALDDKQLVERASSWLMARARPNDGFTTFLTRVRDGRASVPDDLLEAAERGKTEKRLTLEEQWQRELFAKGMYEHKTRGTCTSTAIYLNGCFRALGIPTRIVLCIPAVDASNELQLGLVATHLKHEPVRRQVMKGLGVLGRSWASHTFNEVFVGGRWRRLNGDRLGQPILDAGTFGLMTHVNTFSDWADADMPSTWGRRQGLRRYDDVFGGPNPYTALAVTDRIGKYAKIPNDPAVAPADHRRLTITKAYWWYSSERVVDSDHLDDPANAGHFLVHVEECRPEESGNQYEAFYARVGKDFVLRAEGSPDVRVRAERGYWVDHARRLREFYLRIEPGEFAKMTPGVPYALVAPAKLDGFAWVVAKGVTLTKDFVAEAVTVTIDGLHWSDAPALPEAIRKALAKRDTLCLVGHVKEALGFAELQRFTQKADARFFLEADGQGTLSTMADREPLAPADKNARWVVIPLDAANVHRLIAEVAYKVRSRNHCRGFRWVVADGLTVMRE